MQNVLALKPGWTRSIPVMLVMGGIIAIDQVSKYLVRSNFYLGESKLAEWPVRLTYVENTGSAFGLFSGQTGFLIISSIIALALVVYLFHHAGASGLTLRISLGMILGGGISNLVGRIRFGGVTDFLDLRVWPIFNIADSAVVIGIAILAFVVLLRERGTKDRA